MELTPRLIKICDLVDMIDSSMNWSLSEEEKEKKAIVYSMGLDGIPDELIDIGLQRQLELETKEFPTPGQFRALCKPVRRPDLKLLTFEDSVKDNELNQKNAKDILNKLGVDLSEKGRLEDNKTKKKIKKQANRLEIIVNKLKKRATK